MMRDFIKKTVSFLLMVPILFYGSSFYFLQTESYKTFVNASVVYNAINKSKKKCKAKKLILGDSVGEQLFPLHKDNDTIISLATNSSVNMVGQFLLLNNYLKAGNRIEQVYLILNPLSFQNNLHEQNVYNYFIKPFYVEEYMPYLNTTALKKVDKIPFNSISQHPCILTNNLAPNFVFFLKGEYENYQNFLSQISAEYLIKMKDLSMKYDFKLIILPAPVIITNKSKIEGLNKVSITTNNLNKEFKEYLDKIIYLNGNYFIDGFHLKNPKEFTKLYKNKFMN